MMQESPGKITHLKKKKKKKREKIAGRVNNSKRLKAGTRFSGVPA